MTFTRWLPGTVEPACIESLKGGDREAFVRLVRAWETRILQTADRILCSTADAEDVRQIVLLRIYQQPEKLPDTDRFSAWLRRCVVNESLRRLRKRKVQVAAERQLAEQVRAGGVSTGHSRNPADTFQTKDEVERLRQAMARLLPEQRALVSLRFDDELTIRQIAEVMELPRATVHSQLLQAIRVLHRELTCVLPKGKTDGRTQRHRSDGKRGP